MKRLAKCISKKNMGYEDFLDTNILLEYFCNRTQAKVVEEILQYIENKKIEGCISVGSFYTLIYLIDKT